MGWLVDPPNRFHLLKYGLALVQVFVGVKMLIAEFYKVPISLTLGIVASFLASFLAASIAATRNGNPVRRKP